jgi:ketosteroid isomerase-like protein
MSRRIWMAVIVAMSLTHVMRGQDKASAVPAGMQNARNSTASSAKADEDKVWQLERSYWEYVKALDVPGYKSLWHDDFVGWPSTATAPMHKDHITDWLEEERVAQDKLQCYKLEPAGFTVVGDVAVTHYHLTEHWLDKNGKGEPRTIKVTHTWLRVKDSWQIIGGMAAVVATEHVCD